MEAVSGGGAKQLSPRQALPRTIHPAIPNHEAGRGVTAATSERHEASKAIEGEGVGGEHFGIIFLRAAARRAKPPS